MVWPGVASIIQKEQLKLLEDLKVVVEANQARRKPKVKGSTNVYQW
jgi:hypothetical protein